MMGTGSKRQNIHDVYLDVTVANYTYYLWLAFLNAKKLNKTKDTPPSPNKPQTNNPLLFFYSFQETILMMNRKASLFLKLI